MVLLDWFFMFVDVANRMFREIVIIKGILFTNIMSTPRTTSLYRSMITIGMLLTLASTRSDGRCTVFPLRDPTSGPNMCSAARISSRVIGQLGSNLLSTILMNAFVLGLPILFCISRASTARE